jgi:hypothetical protein
MVEWQTSLCRVRVSSLSQAEELRSAADEKHHTCSYYLGLVIHITKINSPNASSSSQVQNSLRMIQWGLVQASLQNQVPQMMRHIQPNTLSQLLSEPFQTRKVLPILFRLIVRQHVLLRAKVGISSAILIDVIENRRAERSSVGSGG